MDSLFKPNLTLHLPGAAFYPFGDTTLIRPLNIANIKQLSLAIYNNDIGLLERTVADCVNFDVTELYISDWWYLLWWLRLNSYKNFPMQISYTCPHCETTHTHTITTDTLQYEDIHEGFDPRHSRVRLDNYENEVRIRPPKVGDETRVRNLLKQKMVNIDSKNGQSALECMRTLAVLETETMSLDDIYIAYRNDKFTPDDLLTIEAFVDIASYGVKNEFKLTCATCKEEVPVAVDIRPLDFFPANPAATSIRERILLHPVDTPAVH